MGYSQSDLNLFKRVQLEPVKDLKLLVKDYSPIAKNALTILINISHDAEVLKSLANDDAFLETLLSRITVCQFIDTENPKQWTDSAIEQEGAQRERNCHAARQHGQGRLSTTDARAKARRT